MNPEFQRNLWLELTLPRLLLMAGFVLTGLAIFSAAPPGLPGPAQAATALYYFLVVLWGTRNAGLSVITEIRQRTWDFQKLSAISPFAMMWGKLLGATSFVWFGGLLCLLFIIYPAWRGQGAIPAIAGLTVLLLQGVLAQSISLLTSLNLIRRQHNYWRLDAFLCQVAGIAAAFASYGVLDLVAANPRIAPAPFSWWGMVLDPASFRFFSLAIFTAWALVGSTRAMRRELRRTTGPFVWLAFLAFLAVYEAGFESWFAVSIGDLASHAVAIRLGIVVLALASSAYGMAFLEPKDPAHIRWLVAEMREGRVDRAFLAFDCWMLSYGATVICALALAVALWGDPQPIAGVPAAAFAVPTLAALGFFSRDIAIFVLCRTWSREQGDFVAVAVLIILYGVLPHIAGPAQAPLLPQLRAPAIALAAAWVEAAAVWVWTASRIGHRVSFTRS